MKRLITATSAVAILATGLSAQARGSFDAEAGALRVASDPDTLLAYTFETPESVEELTFVRRGPGGTITFVPSATAFDPSMLTDAQDAIEGAHALRLGSTGLSIGDAKLFADVRDTKFEVSLWARADGSTVDLTVYYDTDTQNVGFGSFATVRGIPTGRMTSDGWAEYLAGPIDGSVWGVPVAAITATQSRVGRGTSATVVVDAIEVRRVKGTRVPENTCTQHDVDKTCGAEGDCMFGRCVPSTFTWGLLPGPAQTKAIVDRWVYFATHLIGDRNAASRGREIFAPEARALAKSALSSRQFFGGLNRLVNGLRDNHTSFGAPPSASVFAPTLSYATSSSLGACFGVVERDLAGGGLGYAVFQATEMPLTKIPLRRGDLVVAIDGRDPKAWVDEIWPRFASAMPNDPASDWAPSANDLSRLLATRAQTVTFARCASSSSCTGDARQTFTIDIAKRVHDAITSGVPAGTSPAFMCTPRFSNTVDAAGGSDGAGTGEDPVYTAVGAQGESRVQFDGFVGQDAWRKSFKDVFGSQPGKVMIDARMGHGGYGDAIQFLLDLTRGTSDPAGVMMFGRGTYDTLDPAWLFTDLASCAANSNQDFWKCYQVGVSANFPSEAAPPGGQSRIAWLNTYDVSANDFMPKLLQGRANFKIFAPHPTSGAFGSIIDLPVLWNSYRGSLQIQDSRFATSPQDMVNQRWESGHGVPPDVVVAEKLSDAIDGVDTIVNAAQAWLAQP